MALSRRQLLIGGTATGLLVLGACTKGSDSGDTGAPTTTGPRSLGPATDPTRRTQSLHVPMRDGVRIAVDVWLPVPIVAGTVLGTVFQSTRYHRADQPPSDAVEDDSNLSTATFWNEAGYAWVVADARGSGASFGSRRVELADDEIRDYGEVADWIAAQPWSNGRIGLTGISYGGDTAEHTLRLANPHVVAAAARFSDWDPYRQLIYPGGAYTEGVFGRWLSANRVLDGVDGGVEAFAASLGIAAEAVPGLIPPVKPVDGPDGPALLAAAIAEHQDNVDLAARIPDVPFRDDQDEGFGWDTAAVAPRQADIERGGVPLLVQAGWLDAGTAAGALTRLATMATPQQVTIGAWSHGGTPGDPFRPAGEELGYPGSSKPELLAQVRSFFDGLVQRGEPASKERSLRYATLGEDGWRTATQFPPPGITTRRWYLDADQRLGEEPPSSPGSELHVVDPTIGTGDANRWGTNLLGQPVVYAERAAAATKMLRYTTAPLADALRLVGVPIVTIHLTTSGDDGVVFAYLEAVGPDGQVTYLTEGQLRFLHRQVAPRDASLGPGVPRTFARADALPVEPGVGMELVVDLLPTAALVPAGHALQLGLTGHDASAFARYGPADERFTVAWGGPQPAHLDVPVEAT